MSLAATQLAQRYAEILNGHILQRDERAFHLAYELGRQALNEGIGVLDLVRVHHQQLSEIFRERGELQADDMLSRGAEILAECLSAFEMSLRGYQEANARLKQANTELASAHESLTAEIADRKRAEEALIHAQKLQAVGLLAGGIAHNFNNLLTVVLGNLELALLRASEDAKLKRYLTSARQGAERGAEVSQQLLTFSRKQTLAPRVVNVSAWLSDLIPLLSSALSGSITLESRAEPGVSNIFVDPAQLELAILNLAVNARDAMPKGGRLLISAENAGPAGPPGEIEGEYVVIAVSDTGQGVAADVLPHIFEPFFTTKEPGAGTGLGLSQVHGFVHQSGGAVDVQSTPGEGTTVRLYLPAVHQPGSAADVSAAVSARTEQSGRVLIVEDDPQVGELAATILEDAGYSVLLVERPQRALELLGREELDLVFSDIAMPGGMNGVEFAEVVRERYPRLPILLTSGFSSALGEAAAKGLTVLQKPYRIEELRARIDQLIAPSE